MTDRSPPLPVAAAPFISARARDLVSVLGLLIVTATLVATRPQPLSTDVSLSLVAAGVLICIALVVPAVPAYLAGQLALVPLFTGGLSPAFGLAQLALVSLLVEPARAHGQWRLTALTVVIGVGLGATLMAGSSRGVMMLGAVLCLGVGVGVYLTHRLTLVRLDLVSRSPSDTETVTADHEETTP